MSRLYGKLQGAAGQVTRRGHSVMSTEILYNFDGGNSEDGKMVMTARVDKASGDVHFTLEWVVYPSGNVESLGDWTVNNLRTS